jgi:hypothetical protein
MASHDEVMETLRQQNTRFTNEKVASSFKGWNRRMRYVFPDIGLSVTIVVQNGIPEPPVKGGDEEAQILYEMASNTLLEIARKEISGMQAYTRKLVKVKASLPDLLKLQKLDSV